jgi:superfamily II DNA/RNA helicase
MEKSAADLPIYEDEALDIGTDTTTNTDVDHSSGFSDFLLKPEIMRAITDAGFEHPSEG